MRRKLPTIFILMVMVLIGAMYWVDLSYYTDPATGFITRGPVWARYCVVALPVLMCLLGLRTVGPKGIAVLRMKSPALGGVFTAAAVMGVAWGGTSVVAALQTQGAAADVFMLVQGILFVAYAVWMLLCAIQLFGQKTPSPTKSAIWGVLAGLPFCLMTVYRILVRPSSLHRVGPLVRSLAPLIALLWFVLLLRSFYVALPRRRVRWLYFFGVVAFLFCTCLELPLAAYNAIFLSAGWMQFFESFNMAVMGLVAGCVSVAIAGQSDTAGPAPLPEDEDAAAELEE